MILLKYLPLPAPYPMILDAVLLVVLIFPALFFFVYKPLATEAVKQRKIKDELEVSQQILQTVLDSLDAVVYVTDIQTYELLFLNKYARKIFGDNVGKICWQVLQTDQHGPCAFCTNDQLISEDGEIKGMYAWEFQNTKNKRWYDIRDRAIRWSDGRLARLEIATDFTERKLAEVEKEKLINKLQMALDQIKALQGILPICSYCKKIRSDEGYWKQVEDYLGQCTGAQFSHGICPDCMKKNFPEYDNK
jgi:PAS domain-containing protein